MQKRGESRQAFPFSKKLYFDGDFGYNDYDNVAQGETLQ